jgi:arginyl-tRNA synthetase
MLVSELIKKELEKVFKRADFTVSLSERPEFGDYSTNLAFVLAKERKQSPFLVAEDLKKDLGKLDKYFEKIEVKNGYLNFFLSKEFLIEILNKKPKEFFKAPKKKKVIVEYSSPNIGKQLSIAHIRSTIIGDALARIYKFLDWEVITDNHLGDWGMLVGKLIVAYKKYSKTSLAKLGIKEMNKLYVKFTSLEKENSELTELAKQETLKLQTQDKESLKIWKALLKNSLKEFKKLYQELKILPFNYQHGESFYQKLCEKIVKDFEKKGFAKQSQGALIVELPEKNLPPVIIKKSDGAFLYATSDIATVIYRQKTWNPDLVLYVVANEQALHFEQVFSVAKNLNLAPKVELVHVKFGMLLGQDKKKLATRSGKTVLLEEVMAKAVTKARKIAQAKSPGLAGKGLEKIAKNISVSAIKYNDLSQNRNTDIVFDWDKTLSLEGNSAPYIQYTYARFASILNKARFSSRSEATLDGRAGASGEKKARLTKKDLSYFSEEEQFILRKLTQFPEIVYQAAEEYLPNLIANYVFELANLANSFYEKYPVLRAKKQEKKSRLVLVSVVLERIKSCLSLLGIEALSRI